MINTEFIKKYGKYGFHFGRIMPNRRYVGFRVWFKKFNGKYFAIEKTFNVMKYL